MGQANLTDTQGRADFFQQSILKNLGYWQLWVANNLDDVSRTDRERGNILNAISFALDLEEKAWAAVCQLIVALAPYMEWRGQWEIWNRVLNRAIDAAQQSEDVAAEVQLSTFLARLLYRQSRFREAVAVYRRVIHLSRQLEDNFSEARACTNLGYFYVEQGYLYRAEILCCYALTLFGQINNYYGLAHTENHLGALYLRQHAWDKAQSHFERACQFWERLNDQHGLMYGYMNLGVLYVYTKQADQALLFSEKALDQARNVGEELDVGTIYMNMGLAHQLKGDLATAEKLTWQAEAIFQRFSNLIGLAHAHENLGLIYIEQQKWPETGLYLAEALAAWRILGNKHNEIQTIGYLAKSEIVRGNLQQAKFWLKEAEEQLRQYGPVGLYHQLQKQLEELYHSLDKGEQDKSP